jgi:hypothetical protein
MALGSTQPLTEMNTRYLPGCKGQLAGAKSWQPHRHLWADCLENVGASTSHNPIWPPRPVPWIALPFTSYYLSYILFTYVSTLLKSTIFRETTCFFLAACLPSTLKMDATSINFYQSRRHIPEGSTLHSHGCENLRSKLYLDCASVQPTFSIDARTGTL